MPPSIEILVHVSGPSRVVDDGRYRKEAQGILDFEPVKRHVIYSRAAAGVSAPSSPPSLQDGPPEKPHRSSHSWAPRPTLHQTSIADSPSRPSQRVQASITPVAPSINAPRVLVERTPFPPRPRTAPTNPTLIHPTPPRRTQSDSWETPPSEIPNSQPTPTSTLHPPSSPTLKRSRAPLSSQNHTSPNYKRTKTSSPSSPHHSNTKHPPPPKAQPQPQIQTQIPSSTPRCHDCHHYHPPKQEIHPPPPYPTTQPYKTHRTPSLLTLSTSLPLPQYFRPVLQSRPLDPHERGHWFIPVATWDAQTRERLWTFMTKFVGEGRGGWGVWCLWEEGGGKLGERKEGGESGESGEKGAEAEKGEGEVEGQRGKESVRVYTWGEVVGEIYLLLFLASERKVKGVGARWVDAGGVVVVEMK